MPFSSKNTIIRATCRGKWKKVINGVFIIYNRENWFAILGGRCVWWDKTRQPQTSVFYLSAIDHWTKSVRSRTKDNLLQRISYSHRIISGPLCVLRVDLICSSKNLTALLSRLNPTSHSHLSHKILLKEATHFKYIPLTVTTDSVEKLLQMHPRLRRVQHIVISETQARVWTANGNDSPLIDG